MSSAMKAAALTLLIVIIGFGLMSFLGDGPEGPGENGSGVGSSNSSTTTPVTPVNRLPERQVLKSSISGLVRDEGGTPLPGTTVKMFRLDGGNGVASAVFVSEKMVAADGTFRFDDLAAGLFRFQAALSGYQSHKLDVSLIDGESPPEVVLILTSGMSISGTVYDPLGQPVPNAQIAAFKERVAQEAPLPKRLQVLLELQEMQEENGIVALSDASGNYVIAGLENLSYRLQSVVSGFSPMEKRYISAGSTEVDFVLELGGQLSGTVQDPGGRAIVDAVIEVYRQTGTQDIIEIIQERAMPPLASEQTDGSGFFLFDQLGGGSKYRLVTRASGFQSRQYPDLKIESGASEQVDVTLIPGAVIQGTVYDPLGSPLEGARCKVNPMGARTDGPPIDLTDAGLLTDSDGTFTFDTLEDADYRLIVSAQDYATYQELRIRPGIEAISIQLSDGAAISGSVLDAETSGPISGAMVTVNDVADVKKTAITDGNGRYYVRGITEQRRPIAYVSVTATGYMRSGNVQVGVTEGAESSGQDFFLERNGVVRGVVLAANGSPLQGVAVSARKQHSEQNPVTVNAAPSVTSNADGTFEVIEVSPGTDMFLEGSHSQYLTSESDRFDLTAGSAIDEVVLVMKVGGEVSGIVIDEVGTPIEGAVVAVRDNWFGEVNPESLPNKAYSDAAGNWSIKSLPDGDHTLLCSVSGYLLIERSGVAVTEGHNHGNVELQMVRGAVLDGVVTDVNGVPIEGVRVTAIDTSDGLRKVNRTSGLTGQFHFDDLGRFPVDLVVEKKGFADIRLFEVVVDAAPITIQLEALGGIRGTVIDETGVPLRAFSVSPRIIEGDRQVTRVPARTFQSEDGRYDYDGLQPGTYTVIIGAPGFAQDVMENIMVRSNQWEPLPTVVLGQGGRVEGWIIDAATNQPVAGVKVTVIGGNRNFLNTSLGGRGKGRRDQILTGADGRFEFIELAVPSVSLNVEHRAYITIGVEGVASGTSDLTIAIGSGGIIEGRISDLEGNFLAGTQVLLSGGEKGTDARVQSDRKGFFSFPGLPRGQYTVRVTNFGRGDGTPTRIKNAPTIDVFVKEGTTEYIEFEIDP